MTDETHSNGDDPIATLSPMDGMTRADFLKKTLGTVGFGALMGGLIGLPVAGMALAPAITGTDFEPVDAGPVSQFKDGKYVKVVLDPGAGTPDGYVRKRVAFVRKNASDYTDKLTGKREKYTVISNRCAHLGCPVQQTGETFVCPCHGGAYDFDGRRDAGPPVRPLDRFEWEVRSIKGEDHLFITGEYSLSQSGKRASLRGPGQHSGGVEKLFYPLQP